MREIILIAHVLAMPLRRPIQRDARLQRAQTIVRAVLIDEHDKRHFFGIKTGRLSARALATITSAIHTRFVHLANKIAAHRPPTTAR